MGMIDQLLKLGFSEGEAKTYMAALELGETSVARIAEKAKLERTTVYGFLEGLKKRGLVAISKRGNKTVYRAENPKKLRGEIDEKWKLVETLLPELLSITNAIGQKPTVRFFDTKEGIIDIYRETLEYPNQIINIWMSSPWFDIEDYFRDIYLPMRIEKGILLRAIIPKNEETIPFAKDEAGKRVDSYKITILNFVGMAMMLVSLGGFLHLGYVGVADYWASEKAKEKVLDLARVLKTYQRNIRIFIVNFTEIQLMLRKTTDMQYFVLLGRRMMIRISNEMLNNPGIQFTESIQ